MSAHSSQLLQGEERRSLHNMAAEDEPKRGDLSMVNICPAGERELT